MIRVNFISDRFSVMDGVVADQPFMTVEEPAALTFRELVEELRGYTPERGEWATAYNSQRGAWIMQSVHLADPRRARYWHKAVRAAQ
jgi:hypothetical protein